MGTGVQRYRGTEVQGYMGTGVHGPCTPVSTGIHGYRGTGVTGAIGVQAVKYRMSSGLAQKLRQCTY